MLPGMPVCLVGSGPLLGAIFRQGPDSLAWQVWVCGDSRNSIIGSAAGVGGVNGRPIGAPAVAGAGGLPCYGGVLGMGGNSGGGGAGMAGATPRCVQAGSLPCRPGFPLRWAGFSAEGLLSVADAAGLVRVLSPAQGWVWVPVLDLRAEQVACAVRPDQCPWIVGMTSSQLLFVACKHGETSPTVMPRPLLQAQPLQMPLAGPRPQASTPSSRKQASASQALDTTPAGAPVWAGDAKASLKRLQVDGLRWVASMGVHLTPHLSESDAPNGDWSQVAAGSVGASTWRRTGQAILSTEKAIDKEILRLLDSCLQQRVSSAQAAAQAGLRGSVAPEERAFHLAQRLVMPRALDLAVRLATQHQRTALADRLHALRRARNREREALAPAMPHGAAPPAAATTSATNASNVEDTVVDTPVRGEAPLRQRRGDEETMTPGGGTPALDRTMPSMESRGFSDLREPGSPPPPSVPDSPPRNETEAPSTPPRAQRMYGKHGAQKRSREAMEEAEPPSSGACRSWSSLSRARKKGKYSPACSFPLPRSFFVCVCIGVHQAGGGATNPFMRAVQQSPAKRQARGLDQLMASSPQKMASRAEADFTSPRRLSRQSTFFQEGASPPTRLCT